MNDIQINQFRERLVALGKFGQKNGLYTEKEIINWIADCVNLFYEIRVDSVIIRNFLDHFHSKMEEVEFDEPSVLGKFKHIVNTIGPFNQQTSGQGFFRTTTDSYALSGSFYYVKVAFSAATNTLKNKVEEKRIVPFWLHEQISQVENLKHVASSLELIESKYEKSDSQGLVTETLTLLESVLNLDLELKEKNKLGSKLNALMENKSKREEFGVSEDLVRGMNCGRILRNEKMTHKKVPLKYEFPFLIATSFAYLVLFFVECAVLNGKMSITK